MATLQIRNLDDGVYERMAQEASRQNRSTEGEARYTLSCAYPETPLSMRATWQKKAGQRMQWIFERLREDGRFRYGQPSDPASLANMIGETSPAELFDCLDGVSGPTFEMARRMENEFSCRADWIMSGIGAPFRAAKLTGRYDTYLRTLIDNSSHLSGETELHFVRYSSSDQFDGTLLILSRTGNSWQCYYEYSRFCLSDKMGEKGHDNLFEFLTFVKQNMPDAALQSWVYRSEMNTYPDFTHHHPSHYIRSLRQSEKNDWLKRMLRGDRPQGWSMNFDGYLNKLRELPSSLPEDSRPPQPDEKYNFNQVKPDHLKSLLQSLAEHDIASEHWDEFVKKFIQLMPRCNSSDTNIVQLLGIFHIYDSLLSLHNENQWDEERRNMLMHVLKKQHDFSHENAAAFIAGISVRFHTASDFIRALSEHHIRCHDERKFVSAVEAISNSFTSESNPFANKIMEVTVDSSFYCDDESGVVNNDHREDLKSMLHRDFCFTDEQTREFISMIGACSS